MQEGTVRRSHVSPAQSRMLSPIFWCCRPPVPICVQSGKHKVRVFEFRRVGHPFRIVVHRTKVPVSICGELAGEIMIEAFRGKSWRPDRSLALFLKRNDYVLLDGIFLEA